MNRSATASDCETFWLYRPPFVFTIYLLGILVIPQGSTGIGSGYFSSLPTGLLPLAKFTLLAPKHTQFVVHQSLLVNLQPCTLKPFCWHCHTTNYSTTPLPNLTKPTNLDDLVINICFRYARAIGVKPQEILHIVARFFH